MNDTCTCRTSIVPMHFKKDVNSFIHEHHRHHGKVAGYKFAIGLFCHCKNEIVGIAICGRPNGRFLDTGRTLEVNRLCVKENVKNGCSKLYGACSRIAREMGYEKIITFILDSESGKSLVASGWTCEAENIGGKEWNSSKTIIRTSETWTLFGTDKKYPAQMKKRWIKALK